MAASRYEAEIGNRLRNIRESQSLSRKDVENRTDQEFKESILAMYENGRRRIPTPRLKKLADFYGVSTAFILGENNNMNAPIQEHNIEAMLASDPNYSDDEKDLLLHVISVIKAKRKAEGKS
jgi:transcriptional regulator with XRE-family HTH domain